MSLSQNKSTKNIKLTIVKNTELAMPINSLPLLIMKYMDKNTDKNPRNNNWISEL